MLKDDYDDNDDDASLDFASSPWSAEAQMKNLRYTIEKVAFANTDPKSEPGSTVDFFLVERMDNLGNCNLLGRYPTLEEAQAAAQDDADTSYTPVA
jgi:hypothetical protein